MVYRVFSVYRGQTMARRQTEEWGIRFGVHVNGSGYEWRRLPWIDEERELLVPTGSVAETGPGRFEEKGVSVQKRHHGLDITRKAFAGFRKLAAEITRMEPVGETSWTDDDGTTFVFSGSRMAPAVSEDDCKTAIVEYANRFGSLWGDNDPKSLKDWKREAADFLDLYDVAIALRRADFREFNNRVIEPRPEWPCLEYASRRHLSRSMVIAAEGEMLQNREASNALPTTVDFYDRAQRGTSRERARMLLSRQVNGKMAGGLNLSASLMTETKAFISPRHLVHLLYTRMWLDTVNGEPLERQVTCQNCQRPIEGKGITARRKFCSEECRWQFHNHRRAVAE